MLQAFKDGKYTDLMIVCSLDDTEFHAHKIILCTQSKFFAKACDGSSDVSSQTGDLDPIPVLEAE